MTVEVEKTNEKTLPPFLLMERMVAGRPDVVLSRGPDETRESRIRESVISEMETLFIKSCLESSARDMSLFLRAPSTFSLLIFLALSGREKSIEPL